LDAVIWVCDESLLLWNSSHYLVTVKSYFICEYCIREHRIKITNIINEKIKIEIFNINKSLNNNDFDIYK